MRLTFLSVPLLVTALACGQGDPSLQVTASPSSFPQGGETTLTIATTDFELKMPAADALHQALRLAHEEAGGSAYTNSGHYHVYLDSHDEVDPILQGFRTVQAVTVHGKAGAHKLIVQLQGEDHKILEPPVRFEVPITLTATTS